MIPHPAERVKVWRIAKTATNETSDCCLVHLSVPFCRGGRIERARPSQDMSFWCEVSTFQLNDQVRVVTRSLSRLEAARGPSASPRLSQDENSIAKNRTAVDIMGTILFKPYQDLGEGLFFDN